MPSKSAKQAKFMRAVSHSPQFAKKVGVPQSVGKDFEMADKKKKVRKFASGDAIGNAAYKESMTGIDDILKSAPALTADAMKNSSDKDVIKEATTPKKESFKEAFAAARKKALAGGPDVFYWNGGSYGTKLRSEAKPAAPKPSAPKASNPKTPAPQGPTPKPAAPKASNPKTPAPQGPARNAAPAKPKINPAFFNAPDRTMERKATPTPKVPRSLTQKLEKPQQKSLLLKRAKGGSVRSVDGCAIRGKTRAPLKKGK